MNRQFVIGFIVILAVIFGVQYFRGRAHPEAGIKALESELAQARDENKTVMLVFSGSDWCVWCIKLEHEILDSVAFKAYAAENLVVVVADFPQDTSGQSDELKARNRQLNQAYPHRGVPAVFLLGDAGQVIAQTGYRDGGPEAYVKHLQQLLGK